MANKQLMLPANRAFTSDGLPEAGFVVYLYNTGTLTPATFYADSGLVTPLGSSITANGAGRLATPAYQNEATPFRLIIKDADGNQLDDIDPFYFGYVTGASGPPGANATVVDNTVTVTTGAAGSSASGSSTHLGGGVYRLSFTIPRGDPGVGGVSDGDYTDITVSGGGTVMTVDNNVVTNAKAADMAQATIKGRAAGAGTGDPTDLTGTQVAAILDAGNEYVRQNATLVHSIPILASSMITRTTNGAASGTTETATNRIMYETYDFDPSTIEYVQFQIPMPKSWNEGTVTAQFIWSSGSTGDVVWQIRGVAISDDDVLDAVFGTAVSVTDSVTATTDQMTSAFTSAVTLGGSPAEGDLVVFQINRNATDAADTCAGDAKLIGIRLNFTTNAKDDS